MPKRLTDVMIGSLKPKGKKRYFIGDSLAPGLFIVVHPTGKKSWVVARRLDEKLVKLSFGLFPDFSVDQAREESKKFLQAYSRGENPHDIRKAEKVAREVVKASTVGKAVQDYLDLYQSNRRTGPEVERFFVRRLIATAWEDGWGRERRTFGWGEKPIISISKRDCIHVVDVISKESSPTRSRRIYAMLHRFFKWCVNRDILPHHPMEGMEKLGQDNRRDRWLSISEIKLFLEFVEKIEKPFGPALHLLLLTGCRREEIGALKWNEIKGDRIELTGERTKRLPSHKDVGRSIPLSTTAQAVLKGLRPSHIFDKNTFVFSTTGVSPISGWGRVKDRLDKYMEDGLGEKLTPWRLHDLRRTLASHMQKKAPSEAIELLLGHMTTAGSRSGIKGIYQTADYSEEAVEVAENWATFLKNISNGHAEEKVKAS